MLLHGGKGDEVIKSFFNEVYAYYVKVSCRGVLVSHLSNLRILNVHEFCFEYVAVNESVLQI